MSNARPKALSNSFASVPRTLLKNGMTSKLIYQELVAIDPGINSAAVHVFSANGLFDPNVTGIGHQPRGFDQLMALFDHYVVPRAKMTARFSSTVPENKGNYCIFVHISDTASPSTSTTYYAESPYTVRKLFSQRNVDPVVHMEIDNLQFLQRSIGASDLKGTTSYNPPEQAYFHVGCFAQNPGSDLAAVDVDVQIDYIAKLFEPKQPGQS
jgi:hypothetical protein